MAHSEETKEKIRAALKLRYKNLTPEQRVIEQARLTAVSRRTTAERTKKIIERHRQSVPFDKMEWKTKRKVVIEQQSCKCIKCGISEWMNEPITLEIDHKNGNNKDDSRDNLEGLCPNCHSQTSTWRGRNADQSHRRKKNLSDEELLSFLIGAPSIRQGLINADLAPKGNNYSRAKKLLAIASLTQLVE